MLQHSIVISAVDTPVQGTGLALSPYLRGKIDEYSKRLRKALGVEPAASNPEPDYVEAPPVEPALVEPSPPPVPKPRRAHGPRMESGRNKAVLRALAAGWRYLHTGDSLKQAARACNASVPYTRAVLHLRRTHQTALLGAALHGDIPLLTAAYRTATATTITVIDHN
jgi:hypothetical protein